MKPIALKLQLTRISITAFSYTVLGKLALLMAIPPGYATAVWPAAGVALALCLVWGRRVAVGVGVGSFLVNLSTSLDPATPYPLLKALGIAAGIGIGAALQAIFGAELIRRYVDFPTSLSRRRNIAIFLLLAGPISCVVSPSVGMTTLFAASVIGIPQLAFSWWTWWVGDSIGVVLVAPLLLVWTARPQHVWRTRRALVAIPLVVCAALVIALFVYVSGRDEQRIRADFELRTDVVVDAVRHDIASYTEIIHSVQSYWEVTDDVDRNVFRKLVERTLKRHPDIHALAWAPLVELADGETEQRGDERFLIELVEPKGGNQTLLGFDIGSVEAVREAIAQTRTSGVLAVTPPVAFARLGDATPPILMLLPVYQRVGASDVERPGRRKLRGITVGFFRALDILAGALHRFDRKGVDVRLFDISAAPHEELLYSSQSAGGIEHPVSTAMMVTAPLTFGSRRWELRFAPTTEYAFLHRSWYAWGVLAMGLLFTSFLGVFLLVLAGEAVVVEQQVQDKTQQLKESEHRLLASLKEKEVLLKEIHHRVKNNLQVISSLLNLQAAQLPDEHTRQAFDSTQNRIQSIALVHEKLYQSTDLSHVNFDDYVKVLMDGLLHMRDAAERGISCEIELSAIRLPIDLAIPCGLIVNELVTNSLKYAFPQNRPGRIQICLRRSDVGTELIVADDGIGLPNDLDPRNTKSLGLDLVFTFAEQLEAQVDVKRDRGTKFQFRFQGGE